MEDLVASYLFEVTTNQFKEVMWRGIYKDDRFLAFKGNISSSVIQIQRDIFIEKVNKIVGNYYLQFTCDTWNTSVTPPRNET